jgi:hypothetical protein
MEGGYDSSFVIFLRLHLQAFQPSRGGSSKGSAHRTRSRLTNFDHSTHHARINDILAQVRYSPKKSSTTSPTLSLIPIEPQAWDPNPGPEVQSLQALAQRGLHHRTKQLGSNHSLVLYNGFPAKSRVKSIFSHLCTVSAATNQTALFNCNWSNGLVYET